MISTLTNYESLRDGKLDVDLFTAVSPVMRRLSCARFGSDTYQTFLQVFRRSSIADGNRNTVAKTAKGTIHYAGFLGIIGYQPGRLTRIVFKRDSTKQNN